MQLKCLLLTLPLILTALLCEKCWYRVEVKMINIQIRDEGWIHDYVKPAECSRLILTSKEDEISVLIG